MRGMTRRPTALPGFGAFIFERPVRTDGRVLDVTGATVELGGAVVEPPEAGTDKPGELGTDTVGSSIAEFAVDVSGGVGGVVPVEMPGSFFSIGVMPAAASSASKLFVNLVWRCA